ncbi:MAG: ferrous iron transport protein B [Mycobacterium leprae]
MAHDCCETVMVNAPAGAQKIVLAGNPNVGKSVVFQALTGIYVEVSNYPGTTVDVSSGHLDEKAVLYDTPGVYGVSAFNEEERVARDMILQADAVINVVDAAHLDRDLFLTLQIIDMGFPVVVALNMMDEAAAHGLAIDTKRLSELLGVPVIPTVATRKQGVDRIRFAVRKAKGGNRQLEIVRRLPAIENPADALLAAEDDEAACSRHGLTPSGSREEIYRMRRERVDAIAAAVVQETNRGATFATKLGLWSIHPIYGPLIMALFLVVMYELVGVFLAQYVVNITEKTLMDGYYVPWMTNLVAHVVRPASFIGQVLVGEFGLLTMTVTYVFGLLLPLVIGFYLVLSFMEDSGYLPRVAVLVDRLMTKVGLNGRAIIPMILGFGCVTMATMSTRLMGTKRERTIATFLLSLAIPCSAQLAVIAAMLAPLGPLYGIVFALILLLIYGVAGAALDRVMPGRSSDLLIDLPPLRWPSPGNTLQKTYLKAKMFLTEAGGIFAIGSVLVSVLSASGVLERLEGLLAPITVSWLGLPKAAAKAFIMGFVRRDFGAAGLYDLTLTPHQVMVSLMTITLFVPCIASVMIMLKERGKREGLLMWVVDLAVAIFLGGIINRVLW